VRPLVDGERVRRALEVAAALTLSLVVGDVDAEPKSELDAEPDARSLGDVDTVAHVLPVASPVALGSAVRDAVVGALADCVSLWDAVSAVVGESGGVALASGDADETRELVGSALTDATAGVGVTRLDAVVSP